MQSCPRCKKIAAGLAIFAAVVVIMSAIARDAPVQKPMVVSLAQLQPTSPPCTASPPVPVTACPKLRYYAIQGTGRLTSVEGLLSYLRAVGYFETAADLCARIHVFVLYENDGIPTASLHSIRELLSIAAFPSITLVRWQEWNSYAHENPWAVADQQRIVKEYEKLHHIYPDFTWAVNTPYQFFKKWVCNELRRNHSRELNITYERVFRTRLDYAPLPGDHSIINIFNSSLDPNTLMSAVDTIALGTPQTIDLEAEFSRFEPFMGYHLYVNNTPELKAKFPDVPFSGGDARGWWLMPEVQMTMWYANHGIRLDQHSFGLLRFTKQSFGHRSRLHHFARPNFHLLPYVPSKREVRAAMVIKELLNTSSGHNSSQTGCTLYDSLRSEDAAWSSTQLLGIEQRWEPLVPPFVDGLRCNPCLGNCEDNNLIPSQVYDQFAIDVIHTKPEGSRVVLINVGSHNGMNHRLLGTIREDFVTNQVLNVENWNQAKDAIRGNAYRGDYVVVVVSAEAPDECRSMAADLSTRGDFFLFTAVTDTYCFVSVRKFLTATPLDEERLKLLESITTAAAELRRIGVRARLLPW